MNLSNVPSEAIRQAVTDMERCHSDPRYTINLNAWHSPGYDACHVCLAGAVMSRRTVPTQYTVPSNYDDRMLLFGLDKFADGRIEDGLLNFQVDKNIANGWYHRRKFSGNITSFMAELLILARDLEREGL